MNIKQQLQLDLRAAMRAQDRQQASVIRLILAAIEKAQEAQGRQSFEAAGDSGAPILPDRHQALSQPVVEEILRSEIRHREEAAELLPAGQHPAKAELEADIDLLRHYLVAVGD